MSAFSLWMPGLCIALAWSAVACATRARGERFLFTDPGQGIVAEPLRLGPTVIGETGEPVVAAEWTGSSALLRRVGLFNGLEGSPVLDEGGELCGMLTANRLGLARFGDGSSPWLCVVTRPLIDLDLARGRRLGHELEAGTPISGELDDLQPGAPVAVVRWWGTFDSAEYGTIAWREEGDIYGSASDGWADTRPAGPALLALARVRVIDFVRTSAVQGSSRMSTAGDVVGTVVYEGAHGFYARLGVAPPIIEVAIDVELDGERIQESRFAVVGDPRLWRDWLGRILAAVLNRHFGRGGGTAQLAVQVEEEAPVPVEVAVVHERTAAQEALAHLAPEVPRAIRITLTLR